MSYFFSKILESDFEETEGRVRNLLKEQGFGVITEIDIQTTMKKKLDINFKKYKILGACNPEYAYKALLEEDKIGLMLPCNLVITSVSDGKTTEVAAIDPVASMIAVGNKNLTEIAIQIRSKLKAVIESL